MVQTRSTAETLAATAQSTRALTLQYEVARLLAGSETIPGALFGSLKKIVHSGNWDIGVGWLTEENGSLSYQCEDHKSENSRHLSQIQAADLSVIAGLPGEVLKTRDLVWAGNIRNDTHPALRDALAAEKRQSALAFPLSTGETIHGVIALCRSSTYSLDDNARRMFEVLGGDIGQFLHARHACERHLERTLWQDEITELPSWPLFLDRGRQMLLLAERNDTNLAVLHINLDFSTQEGGADLRATAPGLQALAAEALSSCVRAYDTVARLVNNEFVVLLPKMNDADDAMVVARKIIATMSQGLAVADFESVNTSVGVAGYPQDGFDMPTLLQQAKTAMLHAKSVGINQCVPYRECAR